MYLTSFFFIVTYYIIELSAVILIRIDIHTRVSRGAQSIYLTPRFLEIKLFLILNILVYCYILIGSSVVVGMY